MSSVPLNLTFSYSFCLYYYSCLDLRIKTPSLIKYTPCHFIIFERLTDRTTAPLLIITALITIAYVCRKMELLRTWLVALMDNNSAKLLQISLFS